MKIRIFYASKTGNTKKVAEAIGAALGLKAETVEVSGEAVEADILLIGGAVYATSDHDLLPSLRRFIQTLDPGKIGKAAVFCTGFENRAGPLMRGLLSQRGIRVAEESFFCKGKFLLFNVGHPDGADLEAAAAFARKAGGEAKSGT